VPVGQTVNVPRTGPSRLVSATFSASGNSGSPPLALSSPKTFPFVARIRYEGGQPFQSWSSPFTARHRGGSSAAMQAPATVSARTRSSDRGVARIVTPNEPVEKVCQDNLSPKWHRISGTRVLCFLHAALLSTCTQPFVDARGVFLQAQRLSRAPRAQLYELGTLSLKRALQRLVRRLTVSQTTWHPLFLPARVWSCNRNSSTPRRQQTIPQESHPRE
jgi:hypothetical protein